MLKRFFLVCLVMAAVLLMLTGCSLNRDFVNATDASASVILPEYRAYVVADPRLDPDGKRIRLQTADELKKLIDEAKRQLEESK